MKINELRIGNLINDEHKGECIIRGILESRVYISLDTRFGQSTHIGYIQPIELTPEWLERLGFEGDRITYDLNGITLEHYKTGFYYLKYRRLGTVRMKIDYVHQLQNLYFALTGEEIKISELIKK